MPSAGRCASDMLSEGIRQYQEENYEEAIELLNRVRRETPADAMAAFVLGMAYKQTMDYAAARVHLQDAVGLTPAVRDAVLELAYVEYRLGALSAAREWLDAARKESISPARTAFLAGLIEQKAGNFASAIESFAAAKAEDPALTQTCDYQIALCHLQSRNLTAARNSFESVVLLAPRSDLANFARRYQDIIERQAAVERPLHLFAGVYGQYDTNVVLKPGDDSAATDITDETSTALATNVRIDYLPRMDGPWRFNAQYAYYGRLHENHSTSYDLITNSLYAVPGYQFGPVAVHAALKYTHALLRDPSYKHYLSEYSAGPLARTALGGRHLLEAYVGYDLKEYAQPPLDPDEDRDARSLDTYLSWLWFFSDDGMFNLRYGFTRENADGDNWDSQSHRISANGMIPIVSHLKCHFGGEVRFQDFENTHTTFETKRRDRVYQLAAGLNWDFTDNLRIVGQYNRVRDDSNIAVYDYSRDVYSLGVEYRY